MFYVHVKTGDYPLSLTDIRRRNPNVSFPKNITDKVAAHFGFAPVTEIPAPPAPEDYRLERKAPELVSGAWVVSWDAIALSPEELADKQAQQWDAVRFERNDKLASSDWTQLADSPMTAAQKKAWAKYRQELRDVPTGQTDPFNIQWPTEPK